MEKQDPIKRPKRWDQPFDEAMSDSMVEQLMQVPPFSKMDPSAFPKTTPLRGILKNDTRILELQEGDIVVREGDYGSSAFLILSGTVDVSLKSFPAQVLGRNPIRKQTFFESLSQLWANPKHPEVRRPEQLNQQTAINTRTDEQGTRIFLQDVPSLLDQNGKATIHEGEIFGELAALSRTPRTATVIARGNVALLELRWQGLRDIIKREDALRKQIEELYRQNSLNVHLRETPIFENLSPEAIEKVANGTEFATYGDFEWQHKFQQSAKKDPHSVIKKEPIIAKEGDYPNGLILIRSGFARVSREHADGEKTESYLGKGQVFGLREIYHNLTQEKTVGWQNTLRAIGYVDALLIPTSVVEAEILPSLKEKPRPFKEHADPDTERAARGYDKLETGLLEFLVENRFLNGKETMMIDMDRCTRCDDCVRACATTHGNNPRFVRNGPMYERFMIANACMHCVDPVCMIGCPTGAIGRDANAGNVTINESTCIGCATCANSCPYDNIKMVELADPKGNPMTEEDSSLPIIKATKCDLCSTQINGPACQNACPHDALVRIDMSQGEKLTKYINGDFRRIDRMKNLTPKRIRNLLLLFAVLTIFALYCWAQEANLQQSAFTSGYALIGAIFFLTAYNIRKKIPFLPLGTSRNWMQLHIYVGLGTIAVFMMHVQFRIPNGVFETLLASLYLTVAGSGLYGLYITRTIPQKLTAVKEEVIFETIPELRRSVALEAKTLVLSTVNQSDLFVDCYREQLVNFFEAPRGAWYNLFPNGNLRRKLLNNVHDMNRYIREEDREICTHLSDLIHRKDDIDFHYALQGRLKIWMFLHIGFTYGLLLASILHGIMAHSFHGGIR